MLQHSHCRGRVFCCGWRRLWTGSLGGEAGETLKDRPEGRRGPREVGVLHSDLVVCLGAVSGSLRGGSSF